MRGFLIFSFFLLPFSLNSGVHQTVPILVTDNKKIAAIQPRDALCIIGSHRKRVESADLLDTKLLAVEKYETDDSLILSTKSGSVAVSSHQLFFNTDRNEWTKAGDIKTGEHYFSIKSPRSRIINIQKVTGLSKLFEISLSYPHVFFIGKAIGLLTHNKPMQNALTFFASFTESAVSNTASNIVATTAVSTAAYGGVNAFYRWMNNDNSSQTVSAEEAQWRVDEQNKYYENLEKKRLQEKEEKFLREVAEFKKEEEEYEKSRGLPFSFNNYDVSNPSSLKYSKKRFKEKKKNIENENRRRKKFEEKMKKNKKPDPEKDKADKTAVIATAIVDRLEEEGKDMIENSVLDEAADFIDEKTGTSYASTANKVYQGTKIVKTLKSDMDKIDDKTFNIGDAVMGSYNVKAGYDIVKESLPEVKKDPEPVVLSASEKALLYNAASSTNNILSSLMNGSYGKEDDEPSYVCSDYRLNLITQMSKFKIGKLDEDDWSVINYFSRH